MTTPSGTHTAKIIDAKLERAVFDSTRIQLYLNMYLPDLDKYHAHRYLLNGLSTAAKDFTARQLGALGLSVEAMPDGERWKLKPLGGVESLKQQVQMVKITDNDRNPKYPNVYFDLSPRDVEASDAAINFDGDRDSAEDVISMLADQFDATEV